jgi:DNA primase
MDVIAPDSENTMLKQDLMEELHSKYSKIIVMFDYDDAGIESMKKYKERYPFIEITVLPMSKDVSDSIRDSGAKAVRDRLVPILAKKLNND